MPHRSSPCPLPGEEKKRIPCSSVSAIFGSPASSTRTRPTQEECSDLWDIMPTASLINSRLPKPDSPSSSHDVNTSQKNSSPHGSDPNDTLLMHNIPKIKIGPPYQSTLSFKTISTSSSSLASESNIKTYAQLPRPDELDFPADDQDSTRNIHYGLGPHLGTLPESIIYSIFGYIDYTERHPTLMLVSRGLTLALTRPEFLLELAKTTNGSIDNIPAHACQEDSVVYNNELLFVVGGKCPIKAGTSGDHVSRVQAIDNGMHRRMMIQSEFKGIMGYDMKRSKWLRFGGDPMTNSTHLRYSNLHLQREKSHPLSPTNIVDAKSIFVGYPLYSIMFFGGTYSDTGLPSNRVIGFSFLTARWERWPDLMKPRHGEDIILAKVERKGTTNSSNNEITQQNDSIVLIGCELVNCDCYRCNPPLQTLDDGDNVMIDITNDDRSNISHQVSREPHTIGKCEVLDLTTRIWSRRVSKAPSSPPDDSGVAVLGGRWVFLPGTCPPPPLNMNVITPLSSSTTSSQADLMQLNLYDGDDVVPTSMDVEIESDENGMLESSVDSIFRTLHYRPGLCYDSWCDEWSTLPSRPYVTTSSPTTFAYQNRVLVLGGYRSSSENALSCYRHREEDSLLDYEDHLDYCWYYTPEDSSLEDKFKSGKCVGDHDGKWTFGGGNCRMGHRQEFASSSDIAVAVSVAASMAMQLSNGCPDAHIGSIYRNDQQNNGLPFCAPVNVRGATMTIFQGRLTMLGGLSTFSRTFYDTERKIIWQFYPETCEWKRASMELPASALLDCYSFSVCL